tara:strand:- start:163 stop:369 length:207 start_codon:yes stop_codon:yes gene_type:complete
MTGTVIANGTETEAVVPCSLEEFLTAQNLLPRSVVVEHNGEPVSPSDFAARKLQAGDRLEIVRIVAGG